MMRSGRMNSPSGVGQSLTSTRLPPILQDSRLRHEVTTRLESVPGVRASMIGVAAHGGAITLSGRVHSVAERLAALRTALHVNGVTAVADELIVEQPRQDPTDSQIADSVAQALMLHPSLPPNTVQATVRHHLVSLTGAIADEYQRRRVYWLVAQIPGVTTVVNNITTTLAR